jgi:hypothetical protein
MSRDIRLKALRVTGRPTASTKQTQTEINNIDKQLDATVTVY